MSSFQNSLLREIADGTVGWFIGDEYRDAARDVLRKLRNTEDAKREFSDNLVHAMQRASELQQELDAANLSLDGVGKENARLAEYAGNLENELKERDRVINDKQLLIEAQAVESDKIREQLESVLDQLKEAQREADLEYAAHNETLEKVKGQPNSQDLQRLLEEIQRERDERDKLEQLVKDSDQKIAEMAERAFKAETKLLQVKSAAESLDHIVQGIKENL